MTERVFERSAARRPMSVPIVYSSFVYRGPGLISGVGQWNPWSPCAESETRVPHTCRECLKKTHPQTVQKMTCLFLVLFVSNLLMQVREVRGNGLEIAEFMAEDTLQQLSDVRTTPCT